MKKPSGIIFDIKHFAIHDGPGIRTTIFLKGCSLSCPWCHNPEGIAVEIEPKPPAADIIPHPSASGRQATVPEIMAEIDKDIIFYDQSGGGVTFSGGEPLFQPDFLSALIQACQEQKLHTCLDTAGYAPPKIFNRFISEIDLFLFDLKIMDDRQHQDETGVSNKFIFQNLQALCQSGKPVIIRIPLIPGRTDSGENITQMAEYILSLTNVTEINLLPFHPTAAHKYARLKQKNPMAGILPLSGERIEEIKTKMISMGIRQAIKIGG